MVETSPNNSHSIPKVGFGPIERTRQMAIENDAAFAAACKTITMGAGVFSAGILLGNAFDYLMEKRHKRRNQNPQ